MHPSQVDAITSAFAPSSDEIERASTILKIMKDSSRGAEALKGKDGREEMIDRPMVLQARRILREAQEAGLSVPSR